MFKYQILPNIMLYIYALLVSDKYILSASDFFFIIYNECQKWDMSQYV